MKSYIWANLKILHSCQKSKEETVRLLLRQLSEMRIGLTLSQMCRREPSCLQWREEERPLSLPSLSEPLGIHDLPAILNIPSRREPHESTGLSVGNQTLYRHFSSLVSCFQTDLIEKGSFCLFTGISCLFKVLISGIVNNCLLHKCVFMY